MKTPHTSAAKGKRIRIVLRTGEVIATKFIERTGQFIKTKAGRFEGREIRSITICKVNPRNKPMND